MGTKNKLVYLIGFIAVLLCFLNFLSVFTPEVGFDALWYHLTLPKLWLMSGRYHFSGGILYYSVMPRLTEWVFTPLIYFFDTTGPKMFQFLSGIITSLFLYKSARALHLNKQISILSSFIYYLSYLVSWQSSSGYIDLFRTCLEVIALYYLIQKKKIIGGIFLGLALGTKWLALFSLVIFSVIYGWQIAMIGAVFLLPWMYAAFTHTGNPFYPLFSHILQNGFQTSFGMVANLVSAPFRITFPFDDFISPISGLLFSLAAVSFLLTKGSRRKVACVGLLGGLSHLILDPPSARFFLPYYPAVVLGSLFLVEQLVPSLQKIFIWLVFISGVIVLCLKIITFKKNVPFLLGNQSAMQYLESRSDKLPETFLDTDSFVTNNLKGKKIIVDKLHNLYYFPYNFDHSSWVSSTKDYNYLVTLKQDPNDIKGKLINTNSLGIQVFELSQ